MLKSQKYDPYNVYDINHNKTSIKELISSDPFILEISQPKIIFQEEFGKLVNSRKSFFPVLDKYIKTPDQCFNFLNDLFCHMWEYDLIEIKVSDSWVDFVATKQNREVSLAKFIGN